LSQHDNRASPPLENDATVEEEFEKSKSWVTTAPIKDIADHRSGHDYLGQMALGRSDSTTAC
jgi:hypothetical protein